VNVQRAESAKRHAAARALADRVKGNSDRARQLHARGEARRAEAMRAEAAADSEQAKAAAAEVAQVLVSGRQDTACRCGSDQRAVADLAQPFDQAAQRLALSSESVYMSALSLLSSRQIT